MRIVGLVSTFKEGSVAVGAVRSLLSCCSVVRVFDGPVGGVPAVGLDSDWTAFKKDPRVTVMHGEWKTDAAKRTEMVQATRRYDAPVWGVVLDGDELLMWGEHLPEQIEHAESVAAYNDSQTLGITLRITEAGGSMQFIPARVMRMDLIECHLISSYHMRLTNGVEVSRPNVPALEEGEPDHGTDELDSATGMQRRRPLHGEPHILHRSFLRSPQRAMIPRLHDAEAMDFEKLLTGAGLGNARGEPVKEERTALWLPPTQ